jgi:hypothetical protein
VFDGKRNCVWAKASGGEYRRGIVYDSPTNQDSWTSISFGAQTAVNSNWQVGFGFDASSAGSTQEREGMWLSSLRGDVFQFNLSATYRNGGFGVGLVAAGSQGQWDTKRFVNINGYSQSYSSFDGIAVVQGVEQPAFSEKKTEFKGISGIALSGADVTAFNPRLRFSHLTEIGNLQIMPFVDVDGRVIYTQKRDETGVGLANLTYPSVTETAVSFTPGIELGLATTLASGVGVRGFVRGGVTLTPDNQWKAQTQFIAAPKGLPPIDIIERFDPALAKVDAGVMVFTPGNGLQVQLNYSGAFGDTTTQHEIRGGLSLKY